MEPKWIVIAAAVVLAIVYYVYKSRVYAAASAEAHQAVAKGAKLVDVRSPEEFAGGHLPNAVNIPVDQVQARLGEFGAKDKPVVIYCRSGNRSGRAASVLRSAGYQKVIDIGPMSAW